ncbi:uncharacterized protein C13orf42 [Aplochiton taeniatus]
MFRKINNAFRPNHLGQRSRDDCYRAEQDYHSACTLKLVRSTSMLVVGERTHSVSSTLKRSKSSVSVESTTALYYYQRQEDRIWLCSQDQNCLEYLEELVALRRQYTQSVNFMKSSKTKAAIPSKKKPAPSPPTTKDAEQNSRARPSAPPVPNEEDTLEFFDAVIASCDPEPARKCHVDDGNADVDFIVATSTSEHDLHSNWVLRVPRVTNELKKKKPARANDSAAKKKTDSGSTSSRLRLQRNPIHLPKVVESAFQTLRFKPKLKKEQK